LNQNTIQNFLFFSENKNFRKEQKEKKNDFLFLFSKINFLLTTFHFMEALVYTFLLIGTLGIIFFAIFFREPPRMVK
jgi:photosystem II PsbT protein